MATTETVSEEPEDREESMDERGARLRLEKRALRAGQASDALPERLLSLFGCNLYTLLDATAEATHERALFKYAAATTKAVAMALEGTDGACCNGPFETSFSTEEAAVVLCGLSALLDEGPSLIQDIRDASDIVRGAS